MLTILIIALIVIFIIKVSAKAQVEEDKKEDTMAENKRISILQSKPPFKYKFPDESKLGEVWSDITKGGEHVQIISFADSNIFIKFKDGRSLTANIHDLDIIFRFWPAIPGRAAEISYQGISFDIRENPSILTERDWDKIFEVFTCAGITHHRDCLTKESRQQAIILYQRQQQMQRQMRTNRIIQQNNQRMFQKY